MDSQNVITGMYFPSAGVRVLVPLVTSAFMEEASGEPMFALSDYNLSASIGSAPGTAFALLDPATGQPRFSAREVLNDTFITSHVMFSHDPNDVFLGNVLKDADEIIASFADNRIGAIIRGQVRRMAAGKKLSRYDHELLRASLSARFGATTLRECDKTNIIMACNMDRRGATLFGSIDERMFNREGVTLTIEADDPNNARSDRIPLYGHIPVTEGILAATAIPGMIGYHCVDSLQRSFMDAGSFSSSTVSLVAEDLHDMALNHVRRNRQTVAPGIPGIGARLRHLIRPTATPTVQVKEAEITSRLIIMGIGNDAPQDYDRSKTRGVLGESPNIVRTTGDMITGTAFASLSKKFGDHSQRNLGLPSIRSIDADMNGPWALPQADTPASDIRDGRIEKLLQWVAFGRHVCIENREIIAQEINTRMKTLQARGQRTPEQVEAVARRLEAVATPEGAATICDRFMIHANNVDALLDGRMPNRLPAPANDGGKTARASWSSLIGWVPGLSRAVAGPG